MFKVTGINKLKIIMTEGDFGNALPIEFELENGEEIGAGDSFKFSIYSAINTEPIITKNYTGSDIKESTIEFSLTQEETKLLPVGNYLYDIDWFNGSTFLSNIIEQEHFIVSEKAGLVNEN